MLMVRVAASCSGLLLRFLAIVALTLAGLAFAASGDAGTFAGVELTIPNETVPAGGMLQMKVQITEPKPISKGGQRAAFSSTFLGSVQGIALFSPSGDASGTAVLSSGAARFSLHSSLSDMGNNIDYPILTVAVPVKATAIAGQIANLVLDPSLSQWVDPTGQNYPVLTKNGTVTVGGTLSISNIVPGGGTVPPGTKIAIRGIGFDPNCKVQVNEATIAKRTFVSSTEIDITLTTSVNMTSRRVRVTKPSTNEQVTYYSYQRTVAIGKSVHPLLARTAPLFSQAIWSLAYFKPILNASQFTGLALQNQTAAPSTVRLRLLAPNGVVLATRDVVLGANRRITRDLAEFFPGVVPATGTKVRAKVISGPAVQMLGLLGDDVLKTVDPIDPSTTP